MGLPIAGVESRGFRVTGFGPLIVVKACVNHASDHQLVGSFWLAGEPYFVMLEGLLDESFLQQVSAQGKVRNELVRLQPDCPLELLDRSLSLALVGRAAARDPGVSAQF